MGLARGLVGSSPSRRLTCGEWVARRGVGRAVQSRGQFKCWGLSSHRKGEKVKEEIWILGTSQYKVAPKIPTLQRFSGNTQPPSQVGPAEALVSPSFPGFATISPELRLIRPLHSGFLQGSRTINKLFGGNIEFILRNYFLFLLTLQFLWLLIERQKQKLDNFLQPVTTSQPDNIN